MYTARKVNGSTDPQAKRRLVVVQFTDDVTSDTFLKTFSFRLTDTIEVMKNTIQADLDELNATPAVIANEETDFAVVEVVPVKTAAEIAKEAWDADWAKLSAIQPYIDAGVFTGAETPIVNLRNKVKTGFKAEYLGL